MNKFIFMIVGLLCCRIVLAGDYYSQHAVGWHWYDDPKEVKTKKSQLSSTSPDPIGQMSVLRKTIKKALDRAILEPNEKNVESYMALENQLSNRANQFADVREKILLLHPELNYSLLHPTNNMALQVYQEHESTQKEQAILAFAKQNGLFFFYRSTCPYCRRFAPILKNFTDHYHISVVPITTDGISLPEFPHSKQDEGQAKKFNVTVEPSLFAVDPYTQKAYPIAYGLISETELRDAIYKISVHEQGGNGE